MPNWVYTNLTVDGPRMVVNMFDDGIGQFPQGDHTQRHAGILRSYIPEPEHTDGDWYEWQVKNWGVKWGDCHTQPERLRVNRSNTKYATAVYRFETAWGFATPGFQTVSRMFPSLRFQFEVIEEAGFFSGVIIIVNGKILFEKLFSEQDYKGELKTADDFNMFDEWKRSRMDIIFDEAETIGWDSMEEARKKEPAPPMYTTGPF